MGNFASSVGARSSRESSCRVSGENQQLSLKMILEPGATVAVQYLPGVVVLVVEGEVGGRQGSEKKKSGRANHSRLNVKKLARGGFPG